jgi:hypothetical protein
LYSVLVLAFSDFLAGSSAAFFSRTDSDFVDEGLDVSFAGPRVLAGILGDEAGGVIGGAGLLSGVPKGLETGLAVAADVGDDIAGGAAVVFGAAVALVEEVTPVVVVLLMPTLSSALNLGAGTP